MGTFKIVKTHECMFCDRLVNIECEVSHVVHAVICNECNEEIDEEHKQEQDGSQ